MDEAETKENKVESAKKQAQQRPLAGPHTKTKAETEVKTEAQAPTDDRAALQFCPFSG